MSRSLEKIIEAMSDPAVYPHGPESVQVIQTHISVIFIAGDLVYKVKKPLNFGFLDFTTLEKRVHFCRQEVRLNSRFSEGIYLGVVMIYEGLSGVNLAGEGEPIEAAVEMRRLPEERVMLKMLEQDAVSDEILDRLAIRLASLHSQAVTGPEIAHFGSPEVILHNLYENFDQTEPFVGRTLDRETHRQISFLSTEFLRTHESLIRLRVDSGFIRDCHGDLHLDHVVIMNGIVLFDCIEFNDRFRYGDTASDLAFLLMDLDFQGYPAFADRIGRVYADTRGDRDALRLLGFYKSYRAFVRGKVSGFTLDEPEISKQDKEAARQTARHYFHLSRAYLEPPAPSLVITCGLMGTGKSFLAAKLARRMGIDYLKSDRIRKEILGISPGEHRLDKYGKGIYTSDATYMTYDALLEKGRKALEQGRSVILDASFMQSTHRARARDLARSKNAGFRILYCTAAEDVIRRRLDDRIKRLDEPSDGRSEIFEEQRSRFEPIRQSEQKDSREWDSTTDADRFLVMVVRELMVH